jgi:hypothetical protein
MKLSKTIIVGGTLLASIGMTLGWGQPPAPLASHRSITPAQSSGQSTATMARYGMKIAANGLYVNVYPEDVVHQWDSTRWRAEVPVIVTSVQYNKVRRQVSISVGYNWSQDDEQVLRAQLAAMYRQVGKPVEPEAIMITPLELASHSLILRNLRQEFLLFETNQQSKLTPQTMVFQVPDGDGSGQLHERLATIPESIQLVLRAGYRFDRIASLTVERRALNTSFKKVADSVMPNSGAKPTAFLVDREMEQSLQSKVLAEAVTVIKSFGLSPDEEREALERIGKLSLPSAPMSIQDLFDLENTSFMLTPGAIGFEVQPATNTEAIIKLKEARFTRDQLKNAAEKISDYANDSSLDDRRFHSLSRKEALAAGASGGFLFFSASANMHCDKQEAEITDTDLQEIRKARSYAMNKSNFSRDVTSHFVRDLEGKLEKSESIAKLLRLRRISAAALAAGGIEGGSVSRVLGSDVLFIDTPVALKATQIPAKKDDVVLALTKQLRGLERRSRELERQLAEIPRQVRIPGLYVGLHAKDSAVRTRNFYLVPSFEGDFTSENIKRFLDKNWLRVCDPNDDKPIELDHQIEAVDFSFKGRLGDLGFFWSIEWRPLKLPNGKTGIEIAPLGWLQRDIPHFDGTASPACDLIITMKR